MLSCEDCAFFIHIDQKSDIQEFSMIHGKNIFFTAKRIPVYWGEFSQVRAVLLLLREAFESPQNYDYFVLLSGSDYPLRSGTYVRVFLEENRGSEFISLVKIPNDAAGKPLARINAVWFPSDEPLRRFVARVLGKLGLGKRDYRKYLRGLEPYSGSAWWALTRGACQYVLHFTENNEYLVEYFQHTFASDEAFFHTILGNSTFRSNMRRNLHYDDWSVRAPHPAMITDKHVALLEAQERVCVNDVYGFGEVLFTRKLSEERLDLLQRIDDMIRRKERL